MLHEDFDLYKFQETEEGLLILRDLEEELQLRFNCSRRKRRDIGNRCRCDLYYRSHLNDDQCKDYSRSNYSYRSLIHYHYG